VTIIPTDTNSEGIRNKRAKLEGIKSIENEALELLISLMKNQPSQESRVRRVRLNTFELAILLL
jgi:hypothetical protein